MIIAPHTHYLPPEVLGSRWVIREVDNDTGLTVAEVSYPTEDFAWAVFNVLMTSASDEID